MSAFRDFFEGPVAQLVVWLALLAILVAVAVYILGKIRAASAQQEPNESEMLSKFRELHAKGELSDAEYRTIKTKLATRLQEKIKGNGETG